MKRVIDIITAGVILIVLSPLFLILIILVRMSPLGAPVFFIQVRPGLHGKPFKMIKFRTMKNLTDSEDALLPDHHRLSSFGRFLRASSMDELPELWNVIKGDMSLVGPRPLLMEYLTKYNSGQMRRHDVLPGITGWAQVNGRNAITWDEKFKLDVWYVDNHSILLDMKILLLTIKKVFVREGISPNDCEIMPRFDDE